MFWKRFVRKRLSSEKLGERCGFEKKVWFEKSNRKVGGEKDLLYQLKGACLLRALFGTIN